MLLLKSKLHGLDGTDHSPIPAGPAVLELDSMSLSPTKPGDFDAWAPLLHLLKEEAWFFAGLRRGSFPVPLRREEFWLGDKVLFYEHSTKPSVFNPSYIPLLLSPLFRGIWSLFFLSLSGVLFYSKNQPPSEPLLKKAFQFLDVVSQLATIDLPASSVCCFCFPFVLCVDALSKIL